MKLFQIITSEGEFNGRFSVDFSNNVSDDELEIISDVGKFKVQFCAGDRWTEENPTNISDEIIKKELIENNDKVYWSIKNEDYIIKITDEEVIKDRVYIRKSDREIYESIKKSEGDLEGISNMDLFLMAMMLGYNKRGRQSLNGFKSTARDGFVRMESFPDYAWKVIRSIAVYEEEYMEVLLSTNKMFDIAEKYAIVGIHELNKLYFENEHNFLKRMEKLLIDEYNFQDIALDISDE